MHTTLFPWALRRLTRRWNHVTEFGTRWGVSTTALLCGRAKVLVCYDRERLPAVEMLERAAREAGRTRFVFRQADVREVEIEETDLLFIDTWHVYDQLRQELALHAGKVRKYLMFHDTTTYGDAGETPGHRGLWPAIEEFLRADPNWTLAARFTHNNGLTILQRSLQTLGVLLRCDRGFEAAISPAVAPSPWRAWSGRRG